MAVDFPSSPTAGNLVTVGSRQWQYNGTGWAAVRGSSYAGQPTSVFILVNTIEVTAENLPHPLPGHNPSWSLINYVP